MVYLHTRCLFPQWAFLVKHRATWKGRNIAQRSVVIRHSRWFGLVESHIWCANLHNWRWNVFQKWFCYCSTTSNNFQHQQTALQTFETEHEHIGRLLIFFKVSIPSHFVRKYPKKISPDKIRDTGWKKRNAWKIWMRCFISNDSSEVLGEINKCQTAQFRSKHIWQSLCVQPTESNIRFAAAISGHHLWNAGAVWHLQKKCL